MPMSEFPYIDQADLDAILETLNLEMIKNFYESDLLIADIL